MIINARGFIALFSVIIVSAILMLAAVGLSFSGFFGRFNVVDSEYKARSDALASSCLDTAILKAVSGGSGVGSQIINTESCNYNISGSTIKAWATVSNTYTSYQATINTSTYQMTDFKELLTYP
jgi:hypothetical protein